jgi:hypothetical protein
MSKQVPVLVKATTQFDPGEDRVRIDGQFSNQSVVVIWLTQRLLTRLVPHMTAYLEKNSSHELRSDLMQTIQQQRAQSKHAENTQEGVNTPVNAASAEVEWLSKSVDVQTPPAGFRLIFKDNEKDPVSMAVLQLQAVELRQWLNVLLLAYKKAGWPTDVWPTWMMEQDEPAVPAPENRALH